MSTTTAPLPKHHGRRRAVRRATRPALGAALALAVTVPMLPITATPAHAASEHIRDLKITPLFKGSIWYFNYQAEANFTVSAAQYDAGDKLTFKVSPGYQPGWDGDLPVLHTDGTTVMATVTRLDEDTFRMTFAPGVDEYAGSTIKVQVPIKHDYTGDLAEGLKTNAYNPLDLTVEGVHYSSGASYYIQKKKPFSNASLLYATYQPASGQIRMGPIVQVDAATKSGDVTATLRSDGNWSPDCAKPLEVVRSDTDITDGTWDGPDKTGDTTIVSCDANQLVVRVANVPAGYGLAIRTVGWATKTATTYRHYGSLVNGAGQAYGPYTSTATPGVPLGAGTGTQDATSGTVFWDANQNGWRDPGEDITFPGATIAFSGIRIPDYGYPSGYDPEAKHTFLTTDANGNYATDHQFTSKYRVYLDDLGTNMHPNWRVTTGKTQDRTGTMNSDVNTRVDFGVYAPPVATIEKNADAAAFGGSLVSGTTVNWTYSVANEGYVDLTDLKVTDDAGVTVTCPVTVLKVGESTTCTGSGKVTPNTDAMPVREEKYDGNDAVLVPPKPVSAFEVLEPIASKYESLGGYDWALASADMVTGGPLGSTTQEFVVPDNSGRTYTIMHTDTYGAYVIDRNEDIGRQYYAQGGVTQFGVPTEDRAPLSDGYTQSFRNGNTLWQLTTSPDGFTGGLNHSGGVAIAWKKNGGVEGPWGWPTEFGTTTVTGGWKQNFHKPGGVGGLIVSYSSYGAYAIHQGGGTGAADRIGKAWQMNGGFDGPGVAKGNVVLTDTGGYQDFIRNGVSTRITFVNGEGGATLGTPPTVKGGIATKWNELGGSAWGEPVTAEITEGSGVYQEFIDGDGVRKRIYWSSPTGAHALMMTDNPYYSLFAASGGASGTYGFPDTDETTHTSGTYQEFLKGTAWTVMTRPAGGDVYLIGPGGDIATRWKDEGGVTGPGLATSNKAGDTTNGMWQEFVNGTKKTTITWYSGAAAKVVATDGDIGRKWYTAGGVTGYGFAYTDKTTVTGGYTQEFRVGTDRWLITWTSGPAAKAIKLNSGIGSRWTNSGGLTGWGFAYTDETPLADGSGGVFQEFKNGSKITRVEWSSAGGYVVTTRTV